MYGQNANAIAEMTAARRSRVRYRTRKYIPIALSTKPHRIAMFSAAYGLRVSQYVGSARMPAPRLASEYASVPLCG